jgi:hypothetical protein
VRGSYETKVSNWDLGTRRGKTRVNETVELSWDSMEEKRKDKGDKK